MNPAKGFSCIGRNIRTSTTKPMQPTTMGPTISAMTKTMGSGRPEATVMTTQTA